jgi:hypothetical protein
MTPIKQIYKHRHFWCIDRGHSKKENGSTIDSNSSQRHMHVTFALEPL